MTMIRAGLRWGTLSLMLGLILTGSMFTGCNKGANFDPSLLFSLQDYAQDQDYVQTMVQAMDQWEYCVSKAKPNLAGNVSGIPFTDAVPEGWLPLTSQNLLGNIGPNWYYSSFQNASYEVIRFDQNVPADSPYHPAEVEFGHLKVQSSDVQYGETRID